MIRLSVNKQRVTILSVPPIVSGTEKYSLSFLFDRSWDGYDKVAAFVFKSEDSMNTQSQFVPISDDNTCDVSIGDLFAGGFLQIGVIGTMGDSFIPTTYTPAIPIRKGADVDLQFNIGGDAID